eukprot:CAMPEP_0181327456 /NCGR_PEP_ID=MMETSP1101-20121128/22112_1 /TAXON_ID=46948 /ORGANISM="Rhodomonas abbreviata, Strain Caron Lab Isolate" /LENGTH=109 /DNA_ID=CAMNT_0023436119 /DNA_START=587 /DNA_END=912 /DNA_ORIENTATION=-
MNDDISLPCTEAFLNGRYPCSPAGKLTRKGAPQTDATISLFICSNLAAPITPNLRSKNFIPQITPSIPATCSDPAQRLRRCNRGNASYWCRRPVLLAFHPSQHMLVNNA